MKRRAFIAGLGAAASSALWPRVAFAQQPAIPVVGFLGISLPDGYRRQLVALRQALQEAGYVEGRNIAVEFRWAENRYDRLPALAAELVSRHVSVIATTDTASTRAAKAATATIPIVFAYGGDPVDDGLVASFNRPGGNVTGVTFISAALAPKRLELLHEVVPGAGVIGVLVNPNSPLAQIQLSDLQAAARISGQRIYVANAGSELEFEAAFAALVQQSVGALLVSTDPLFGSARDRLVALAAREKIPAIYALREYAAAGGLMSYGASQADSYRQAGIYTARILKGEKPADLPVMQPTKFELVVNLKTAKALGLTISESFLLRADEVIE
jgi:putative tryptophan/tyrosine transport system substrate-binding protein